MTAAYPPCPDWCRVDVDPNQDADQMAVHMSQRRVIEVGPAFDVGTVAAWTERIDSPGEPAEGAVAVLQVGDRDQPLPPEVAWELAKALASAAWVAVRDGAQR